MKLLGCLALCFSFLPALIADESQPEDSTDFDLQNTFSAGKKEFSLGAGVLFSPCLATGGRPTVNYAGAIVQLGYMLNDLSETGPGRGNFEIIGEGFVGGVFKGHGTCIANSTLWLRYNVAPSGWKIVPYLQVGAGLSLVDLDDRIFGQSFSFNLNAALGARYFLNDHTSINAEYRYQHLSNAGLSENNLGINAAGGVLSISWFF